ncbi:MAG TPA: chorismate synthase [bacterium]|jgi:chorismate synthase
MIRYLTAGESHGKCLIGILEGMPAGVGISEEEIAADLHRRQQGYGRGGRMSIEQDHAQILSGVRYGVTLGSPLAVQIENRDWENWRDVMRVEATESEEQSTPLTTPRPGHADYAGAVKYGQRDIRNVIERSSARETAVRVALGAICRKFFAEVGITVGSHVVQIGPVKAESDASRLTPEEINRLADASPVRCLDKAAERRMMEIIDEAKSRGDSVGGIFEVIASGLPVGVGSGVHGDRRLTALLAQAMLSIPAMKSVGFGMAEDVAAHFGSDVHDRMFAGSDGSVVRRTNRSGGVEGGMSTGEPLIIRVAMKPLSTLAQPLETVDLATGQEAVALRERSDVCAVPAAAVVGEAVCMLALMNPYLEKTGGDSMSEIHAHNAARPPRPWV